MKSQLLKKNGSQVFFFSERSSNSFLNPCDDNNNLYYSTDKEGYINWFVNQTYCRRLSNKFDTILSDSEIIIKSRYELSTPIPSATFKLIKKKKYIVLLKKSEEKFKKIKYCNFDFSETEISNGIYSEIYRNIQHSKVQIVKKDTVVYFRSKKFHAYKIMERYDDAEGTYSSFFYIEKKTMLPLFYEETVERKQVFIDNGRRNTLRSYLLNGILSLQEQLGN